MIKLGMVAILVAVGACGGARPAPPDAPRWIASWATSAQPTGADDALGLSGRTLRQVVRLSLGGARLRVRLSNQYGSRPLVVGAAHVALRARGPAIQPASDRAVRFAGAPGVTIAPGATAVSDPIELTVPALGELAISLFAPDAVATTGHGVALATGYLSELGDFTAAATLAPARTTASWHVVTAVDVEAGRGSPAAAIVALGDSITDGMGATPDADRGWPDRLAARLARRGDARAVVNAGIAGNRLLTVLVGDPGLARLERDALGQPGVRYLIVQLGINDLSAVDGAPAPPERITAGHRELIARAHARGLKVYGATLTPFEGGDPGYVTPDAEPGRIAVNAWLRGGATGYDAVIDLDRVVRDPDHPTRLRPAFDSGDHLHPNDAGHQAIADAIDLALFE